MKVALIIERMDLSRGGREVSTAQIAAGLASRGCDVTVLCQTGAWEHESVAVRGLGRRGLLRIEQLKRFIGDVRDDVRQEQYDVVHAMLPVPGCHVYQPRGGTIPGQRQAAERWRGQAAHAVAEVVGLLNLRRQEMSRLERQVVADDGVVCLAVSEMVSREFVEHYGRTHGVRVVYNGVDVPDPTDEQWADHRQRLRFQMGLGRDDPVFLTVAKNFRLKAIDKLIVAFAQWYHSHHRAVNGRLVVVGRDVVEGYQRFAGLREVGGQVVFVPHTKDIFAWYAAADVCALLSWYDPCSRVVLEAARWAIPSITTIYNGAAEILAGGAGIAVPSPKDTQAVVRAMDLLSDHQRRATAGEACLKLADRLSMDRHVEELLRIYEEIAGRKR